MRISIRLLSQNKWKNKFLEDKVLVSIKCLLLKKMHWRRHSIAGMPSQVLGKHEKGMKNNLHYVLMLKGRSHGTAGFFVLSHKLVEWNNKFRLCQLNFFCSWWEAALGNIGCYINI